MSEPAAGLAIRGTIWAAAALYFAALCCRCGVGHCVAAPWYRRLWPAACAAYLLHVVAAFSLYHGWSHTHAVTHVAQRTYEVTGWRWGGGLYVNYLFTALWVSDALVITMGPALHSRRPRWLDRLWLMATLFMFVQGLIVFADGPSRVLGMAGLAACIIAWLWPRRLAAQTTAP